MSVQKQDHPSIKVCIAGISGTGKSTLLEKLIRREHAKWIFVYDHKDGDQARRFGVTPCKTIEEMEAAVIRGGLLIFDYRFFRDGDGNRPFAGKREDGFEFFIEWVESIVRIMRGKKILFADELQALVNENSKPDKLVSMMDELRTFQLDFYFCTSAMNVIHNGVRKQFTEIWAFKQGDKASTVSLEEKGFDRDELMNLKYGEWLYKNGNTGKSERGGKAFVPKNSDRDLRGL